MKHHLMPRNLDEGVCQYAHCQATVPDGITIQLCTKHLRLAYAAFLLTNPVSGVAQETHMH